MTGTYEVEIERVAASAIADLQRSDQKRVIAAVAGLATDPRPVGCAKLTGADAYRIRVGNFRVVYLIDDVVRVVTVTRVAHRREVYRGLS